MPTNLPPQYFEVEQRYRQAKTTEEKIATLREMLAVMPKHKGTDKLQANLRARISKLTHQSEKKKGPHRHSQSHAIARQGAAQVMVVGPPNSGKSTLLCALTKAQSEVTSYPFATHKPVVGMMPYEDILIQLVDTPPIADEYELPWLPEVLQTGDLYLIVVDLSKEELLEQVDTVVAELHRLHLLTTIGENASAVTSGGELEKGALLCANKYDCPGSQSRLAVLEDLYGERYPLVRCAAEHAQDLQSLKEAIFASLGLLRVYTKTPGEEPDMSDPVVLRKGAVVLDAARAIHKEIAQGLAYARIWGSDAFRGQRVDREHALADGDILEFHV